MTTNAQPGWYPDPAGNTAKLRYWDGSQWTEHYAEPQPVTASNAGQPAVGRSDGTVAAPTGTAAASPTGAAAPADHAAGAAGTPNADPSFVTPPRPTVPPSYTTTSFVGAAPYNVSGSNGSAYGNAAAPSPYAPSNEDRTLRLVAFVFAVLCTVSMCWLIIPLAWMVPMTVRCWSIYKGTKPNTVAFGVCTLLFLSLVGGIMLLISKKDQ